MRAQEGSWELDQLLQNIVQAPREASEKQETDTKDRHEKGLRDRKDAKSPTENS